LLALLCLSCGTGPDDEAGTRPSGYRVLFLGDTSLGENYQARIAEQGGKNVLNERGYAYSLERLSPLLHTADQVIANLETPVTNLPISPFAGQKHYLHRADIVKTPETLRLHNIRFVSLANNHTLDYGLDGLEQTLAALQTQAIRWFGACNDAESAAAPLRTNIGPGSKSHALVVTAGFEYRTKYATEYAFYANGKTGGVNAWTPERATVQLAELRRSAPDALIVAYPHFGKNYAWKTDWQIRLAHALIDGGADLVIGHGAHVFQEIEQYRERWIIYNLGNFVFNSPGRYGKEDIHPYSLVAGLDMAENGGEVTFALRLYPILSNNLVTKFQPRLVNRLQFSEVRSLLLEHSEPETPLQERLLTGKDRHGYYLVLDVTPASTGQPP
ncbi:CapA family protein, partial [Gammaproteobacteria bacterium]|nr:CapA family protein [Gammaproteobacteria bacterium]